MCCRVPDKPNNRLFGKPKAVVQCIKVKQSTFDALRVEDRCHFEVYSSNSSQKSSGDEKNPVDVSSADNSGDDQLDGAFDQDPPSKKAALGQSQSGVSGWPRHYAHQRPKVHEPVQNPAPAAQIPHNVMLYVKKSAIDGSYI